jgi:hypothetical protein
MASAKDAELAIANGLELGAGVSPQAAKRSTPETSKQAEIGPGHLGFRFPI